MDVTLFPIIIFFTRKIKDGEVEFDDNEKVLISPADGKVSCYELDKNAVFEIKGGKYSLKSLLKCCNLAEKFQGGYAFVIRLTVDDYHRYCFFDNGKLISERYIKGKLHTVSPISSKRYKVFSENCRNVSYVETENFGACYQVEIGALLVGKIMNHHIVHFSKGEEKGYFEMGGSTCVVMVKKDAITIDSDILDNSDKGIETKVLIGERIGKKNVKAT